MILRRLPGVLKKQNGFFSTLLFCQVGEKSVKRGKIRAPDTVLRPEIWKMCDKNLDNGCRKVYNGEKWRIVSFFAFFRKDNRKNRQSAGRRGMEKGKGA